jgi:hypothetical protein
VVHNCFIGNKYISKYTSIYVFSEFSLGIIRIKVKRQNILSAVGVEGTSVSDNEKKTYLTRGFEE